MRTLCDVALGNLSKFNHSYSIGAVSEEMEGMSDGSNPRFLSGDTEAELGPL